jgi:hypothetical protein
MRIAVVALVIAGSMGCSDAPQLLEDEKGLEEAVRYAAAKRAAFGLSAEPSQIRELMRSGRNAGKWGLVATEEEERAVDLTGRMIFANRLKHSVVPFVESLPTSGGVYIDQTQGGNLVVTLTERNPVIEQEIAKRMPADPRGHRVVLVEHTEKALTAAVNRANEVWSALVPSIQLQEASLDIQHNGIELAVAKEDYDAASVMLPELNRVLGVRVSLEVSEAPAKDTAAAPSCTSRTNCKTPTEAGVAIYYNNVIDSFAECTMAFHVVCNDGDVEFVTAAHCDTGGANSWAINNGSGGALVMGTRQKTMGSSAFSQPQDIMRVMLPVGQKSQYIFGEGTRSYNGSGGCPIPGQAACVSRYRTDVTGGAPVDCGIVDYTWGTHYSDVLGLTVYGGDLDNVTDSIGGDSGSPIYDYLSSTTWGTVGVQNNVPNNFATLCKAEVGLDIVGTAWKP